jgi:hypothetical protein
LVTFGPKNVHGAFQRDVSVKGARPSTLRRSSFRFEFDTDK